MNRSSSEFLTPNPPLDQPLLTVSLRLRNVSQRSIHYNAHMDAQERVTLAVLGCSERHAAQLVSMRGLAAQLQMDIPASIPPGTLVEFQSDRRLWLGEVLEKNGPGTAGNQLRVRLDHSLDLGKLAWIHERWSAELPK